MNQKPIILTIDEAKTDIIQAINRALQIHRLPCYIVDMILTDMRAQLKEGARNELEAAKEQMKKQNDEGVAESTPS